MRRTSLKRPDPTRTLADIVEIVQLWTFVAILVEQAENKQGDGGPIAGGAAARRRERVVML